MPRLDDIIAKFTGPGVDDELRLELLLDYSKRLPALPPEYEAQKADGENRVPECMTPVYLWMDVEGDGDGGGSGGSGGLHIHVDVAEEAPTVKGILSIIIAAYEGADPGEAERLPEDILERLALTNVIRMNRALGLRAIVGRIKRRAAELAAATTPNGSPSP